MNDKTTEICRSHEFTYNSSVSAATGLAPNNVHRGKRQRLPLTVFECTGVAGHQSLARDHLGYCDLATDRQQRANGIVRKHHALTVSCVDRRKSVLADALRPAPEFAISGWAWMYNSASTIRHGVKANTDATVLMAKLAISWTGPYKVLAVGRCSSADIPGSSPLGDNLLYLHLPSDLPGSDSRWRVAIETCKPRANPHDSNDMPKYLPVGMTQNVFQELPSVPRHSRRRFGSPSRTRGGGDHRPLVGPGTRWSHRGATQDALGGTFRTILGAGNGSPTLLHLQFALLGRHSGSAPPNQLPLPPDSHRRGAA